MVSISRQPTCSAEGCEKPSRALTLCVAHYSRQYRAAKGAEPRNATPDPQERIARGIVVLNSGCWEWQGWRDREGYGYLSYCGRRMRAHRLSYEAFVGDIPAGLVIDHLCRNTSCVNPEHLEPVTNRENIKRGTSPIAEMMRNPLPPLVPGAPEGHGTGTAYQRDKCRCDFCREANRLYMRAWKERQGLPVGPSRPREKLSATPRAARSYLPRPTGDPSPDDPRHGTTTGYTSLKCRCDACRAAHASYSRERRRRKLEGDA